MTTPQSQLWHRAKNIVADAMELPIDQRPAFIDKSVADYADHAALRDEVMSLLAEDTGSGNDVNFILSTPYPDAIEHTKRDGEHLGPWRLMHEIGRGGMGVVYLAERADGAYQQQVAIKLLAGLLAGISTKDSERLARERQALATLAHPNVARLIDGGTSDSGAPYLVMEYIEGEPIDKYCHARKLSLRERIVLVRGVCAALQSAHQQLLIHRDVKPANILVTNAGQPKLLDFGIARIVESSVEATSAEITQAVLQFTPRYASPEQISGQPVSVTTDIYGVGLLLYELLAGTSPYARIAAAKHATAAHAIDAILQDEPRLASEVARSVEGSGETTASKLRGDLDAILAKACAKQSGERYQTIAQLDDDLSRWITKRPISARQQTAIYRFGKLIGRHQLATAGVSAALFAATAGIISTVLQKQEAERQYAQTRKIANTFIFKYHDAIAPLQGSRPVRQALVNDALKFLDDLATKRADIDVQVERAAGYRKLAHALFNGYNQPNLGDRKSAKAASEKSRAIINSVLAIAPKQNTALGELAMLDAAEGTILWSDGKRDESLLLYVNAADTLENVLKRDPTLRDPSFILPHTLLQIALIQNLRKEPIDRTLKRATLALEQAERHFVGEVSEIFVLRSMVMGRKVTLAADRGELEDAARLVDEAITFHLDFAKTKNEHEIMDGILSLYNNKSAINYRLARYPTAQLAAEHGVEVGLKAIQSDRDNASALGILARNYFHLGRALFQQSKYEQASSALNRSADFFAKFDKKDINLVALRQHAETLFWLATTSAKQRDNGINQRAVRQLNEIAAKYPDLAKSPTMSQWLQTAPKL